MAGLNILRPVELTKGTAASLRLYCTALKGGVSWQVFWRWVRSIPARQDQDGDFFSELRSELRSDLRPDGFDVRDVQMFFDEDGYHLHFSELVPLDLNDAPDDADYLMIYLLPKFDFSGDGNDSALYLLMAELRWEA